MKIDTIPPSLVSVFRPYRMHILIFLAVFFFSLMIVHPLIIVNDEWITLNQLHQLHDGHQVIINEGKFGLYENGTVSGYFDAKSNILAYSVFLPVIAIPAFWVVDIFGEHFVFFILYLWTILGLLILLLIELFFPEYTLIGKIRWTPFMYCAAFIVFFLNLFFYSSFPVIGIDAFPEILSIVFTNCILLAILGVIIYDINHTIFENTAYAVFGTVVCLSCSSYFFWITGCKDHILIVTLFAAVLMCMIKYQKTRDYWYLPLAFLLSGLLAWGRPELAFWIFAVVSIIWMYSFIKTGIRGKSLLEYGTFFLTPLFTAIGALPFFVNNSMVTKNFLKPPMTTYLSLEVSQSSSPVSEIVVQQPSGDLLQTLFHLIVTDSLSQSSSMPSDIFGIFFFPESHSIGFFALAPIALLGIILITTLVIRKKKVFSDPDRQYMAVLALAGLCVFLAYLRSLHGLNVSHGVMPDVRYLTPMYLPLTLLGLIALKKADVLPENPLALVKKIFIFCMVGIPLSIIILSNVYLDPSTASKIFEPLNTGFTYLIFSVLLITLLSIIGSFYVNLIKKITGFMIPLLCSLPLIWQIDASYLTWKFSIAAAYTFWIPLVRIIISPN